MLLLRKSLLLLLSVIVATCAREPSIPICSKYDYEERLLERVLRNEFALETTHDEIAKTNAKVVDALKQLVEEKAKVESTLAVIEKNLIEMESRLSDFISNASNNLNSTLAANVVTMVKAASDIKANASVTVQQLVNEVHILKDQLKVPTINFRACITTYSTDVSSGLDVIFHTVEENVGQGYDPASGKFTASVPGMYLFSVQYCVYTKKNVHLEIVHQGKTLQRSANYDNASDYPCVTMQVSTVVAMGHQVWVRSTGSSTLYADSQRYTSFSGTLIHV
ncbi:uncharacterized protein LOC127834603 isoform X2 [Dreissena polymorpha]|uniref:uncharacterized protein LOC127834603 isoform X2 n=1 Tax=Dreissena polymorpha TaxID=45954 RepID=UPI00226491AD|nr:uncharacterized protein LOC127834603 isoform X2 [Dreissena polymorpha]